MTFSVKGALINNYFMSNFNYFPLVWMFLSAKSLNRIENFAKKALRSLLSDYESTCEQLLNKAGRSSMSINRLRNLQDLKWTEPKFYEKYFYGKRNR